MLQSLLITLSWWTTAGDTDFLSNTHQRMPKCMDIHTNTHRGGKASQCLNKKKKRKKKFFLGFSGHSINTFACGQECNLLQDSLFSPAHIYYSVSLKAHAVIKYLQWRAGLCWSVQSLDCAAALALGGSLTEGTGRSLGSAGLTAALDNTSDCWKTELHTHTRATPK